MLVNQRFTAPINRNPGRGVLLLLFNAGLGVKEYDVLVHTVL